MILATGINLNLQLLNSSISSITVNITKGIDIIIRGLLHLTRRMIKTMNNYIDINILSRIDTMTNSLLVTIKLQFRYI